MTFVLAIAAQLGTRRLLPKVGPRWTITPGLFLAAIASFALANGSEGLAVLHGYHVGFTWSAAILLAAAVTTALLLRRPAVIPASESAPAGSPATGPARCLAACCA